jgi:hypothetical protein
MSDNKLPARQKPSAIEPGSPARETSIFGKIASAFISRLNTKTIRDGTTEAEAHRLYIEELERLAHSKEKKDRAVAHYVDHLGDLIQDDHEQHLHQMDRNRMQRQLEAQREKHQLTLAALQQEEELSMAGRAAARAQWGLDAFLQSLPYRKERIDHLFKSGAADAALDMIATLKELMDEQTVKVAPGRPDPVPFEKFIEVLDAYIKEAQKKQESDEQLALLHTFRSELSAAVEQEKNRSS